MTDHLATDADVFEPGEDVSWQAYRKLILFQLATHKKDLDSFKARYEDAIAAIQGDMGEIKVKVSSFTDDMEDLGKDIENIERTLGEVSGLFQKQKEEPQPAPVAPDKFSLKDVLTPWSTSVIAICIVIALALLMGKDEVSTAIIEKIPVPGIEMTAPPELVH